MSDAPTGPRHPMLTPRPPPRRLDAVTVLYIAVLVLGLAALAAAVWLLVTLPGRDGSGNLPSAAEETREAQRAVIARLEGTLTVARAQLATADAQEAAVTSTPLPTPLPTATASTVLRHSPLALILDAPVYRQAHSLSCESSAAAMAAAFFALDLGEEAIVAAIPRHDNPHLGFRGDIDGPYGGLDDYGVYAEPVRKVLADAGLQVEHLSGGIEAIREQIRRERVVIAWVTYELQVQTPQQVTTSDGQTVTLVPFEHAVLVTGYNGDGLWVNDPYSGTQVFYPEAEFARSFSYLGNMALVVGSPTAD